MKRDDYVWDPKVEAEPEVAALERALAPAAYVPRPLELPEDETGRMQSPARLRIDRRWMLVAAAVAVVSAIGMWLAVGGGEPAGWQVDVVSGRPMVDARAISSRGALAPGGWISTDGSSRAVVQVAGLGQVTVHPNTRLGLKEDSQSRKLMDLKRGTIHAYITAPPELFLVDTPSALAVDLGCEYTLAVDDAGGAVLEVSLGYVRLEGNRRWSKVPMGAACATRPGAGPGTPYAQDAPAALREALERFDFGGDAAAVAAVLQAAREKDGVTLWHLLRRVSAEERARVYERLAEIAPPPKGVTREGVLGLDEGMLEAWWDWVLF